MTVSQIFKFIDMRKQMNEKKIVKVITNKKTHKIKDIVLGSQARKTTVYSAHMSLLSVSILS